SGAPLFSGLLAGIIGGVVVGFLSDSRLSVSGPAAGMTTIVAASIFELGSFAAFAMAVMLAGLIQIALGFAKGGQIGDYFSNAVIRGMLAGIGIIIIVKQVIYLLGWQGGDVFDWTNPSDFFALEHAGAAFIGIFSLATLLLWNRLEALFGFLKLIPAGLFVVFAGACINAIYARYLPELQLDHRYLVALHFDGGFESFASKITTPDWNALLRPELYKVALTIAVIASLQSLLCIDAADDMDKEKRISSKDKELVAQGAGNFLAGIVGAIPIAAVIVRTSANVDAGAETKNSAILHGVWLILCILLIPRIIDLIPLASLAAILVTVGMKLTPLSLYRKMLSFNKDQSIPFIVTVVVVTFIDLLSGVILGMAVNLFFLIRSILEGSIHLYEDGDIRVVRFMKDASFLNKSLLTGLLSSIPNDSKVVIDSVSPVRVDRDIILTLEGFLTMSKQRNITVEFKKMSIANHEFFKP
ncbi:MAG: SulP family inorganic anion transporter, partial [bacterium]